MKKRCKNSRIEDIARKEFIGETIKVVKAENPFLIGIEGKVIDETRNMLVVERKGGKISKLIKNKTTLHIQKNGKTIEIDGAILIGKPEDRIKKVRLI